MVDEVIQRQQQAPFIEKRSEQLLASVFGDPNAVKRDDETCLLYTSPSPRDGLLSRMPSSA